MAYFLLVMSKAGICRGASSHRNNAGWHELTEIGRPLSGSGYQHRGRDELHRRVEVKMPAEQHGLRIADLMYGGATVPWVAIEAAWGGKAQGWWTFFDVGSAGYASGTDYNSPTGSSISYIFEFQSARWATGVWPGAIRTPVPKVGLDPQRAVERETNQAIATLPVPGFLKRA